MEHRDHVNALAAWLETNADSVLHAMRIAAEKCDDDAKELRAILPNSGYANVLDESAATWRKRRTDLDKIMDRLPEDFEVFL